MVACATLIEVPRRRNISAKGPETKMSVVRSKIGYPDFESRDWSQDISGHLRPILSLASE